MLTGEPWWEVYPGYGTGWVPGEGYTGYYPVPSQDPNISHILRSEPYPRPNESNSQVNDEVSQDGSRIGSRYGPEYDPE